MTVYDDAQKARITAYMRDKAGKISLVTSKERKAAIQEAALRAGVSTNAYILEAVDRRMTKEALGIRGE